MLFATVVSSLGLSLSFSIQTMARGDAGVDGPVMLLVSVVFVVFVVFEVTVADQSGRGEVVKNDLVCVCVWKLG